MKRLFWSLKISFLCIALCLAVSGYTPAGVSAQDEGFVIEEGGGGGEAECRAGNCQWSSTSTCFCSVSEGGLGCTGCYIRNGQGGCGVCVKR